MTQQIPNDSLKMKFYYSLRSSLVDAIVASSPIVLVFATMHLNYGLDFSKHQPLESHSKHLKVYLIMKPKSWKRFQDQIPSLSSFQLTLPIYPNQVEFQQ